MNHLSLLICVCGLSLPTQPDESTPPVAGASESLKAEPRHEIRIVEGWTVHLHGDLLKDSPKKTDTAMRLMKVQLKRVADVIPPEALAQLRKVPIWVNPKYASAAPRAEYHPGAGWLRNNGRDPVMAKAVEVTNVSMFEFEHKRMPYLMLHELAHAYHDRVLGFSHPAIEATFQQAKASGTYDSVRRFTGRRFIQDKAYAMSNAREYFAEGSEALFGKNDFFPFNQAELKKHDPDAWHLFKKLWNDPASVSDNSGDR
ncbi:MAG: metallopeptidase [Planctomycetaceae bacterium]|nr:metallopeptidase [Planctomycetaceae bacterium]